MKIIKDEFIKSEIRKTRHLNTRKIAFPNTIHSVGILANDLQSFEQASDHLKVYFGENLKIDGYHGSILGYENEISSHDFSISGKPNEKILGFLSQNFDFIIVPTLKLSPYLLYLLVNSSCGFKIGFYSNENKEYLDLMIESQSKETETTIQQLLENFLKVKSAC
ncbi:DUF6913 domain-containing protein [Belliella kenyensis]|uniref:DUF6913 domain-containing protein n=1 Tax=Belliella kenyensis TaxID=1472724 RepID=A0ABV8ELW4_9BACT|nr:hypothetical protein [Belliella kenyensis]MCH7400486.1 hypothetical protein [Belliella kenyensis]MDN3604498.1 hypothetical protein [Belliella kenyensis]